MFISEPLGRQGGGQAALLCIPTHSLHMHLHQPARHSFCTNCPWLARHRRQSHKANPCTATRCVAPLISLAHTFIQGFRIHFFAPIWLVSCASLRGRRPALTRTCLEAAAGRPFQGSGLAQGFVTAPGEGGGHCRERAGCGMCGKCGKCVNGSPCSVLHGCAVHGCLLPC